MAEKWEEVKDTADHEKGDKKRRRASEKQNMLCTEDESMIKNVSKKLISDGRGGGERDEMRIIGILQNLMGGIW